MGAAAVLIGAGLAFRLIPWGLPLAIHHYGGGVLWGAMVYVLVAACRPSDVGRSGCFVAAALVIIAVEASRLLHTPALDQFRLTLAGQLLLGRIFSPWNILVDLLGAAVVSVGTTPLLR